MHVHRLRNVERSSLFHSACQQLLQLRFRGQAILSFMNRFCNEASLRVLHCLACMAARLPQASAGLVWRPKDLEQRLGALQRARMRGLPLQIWVHHEAKQVEVFAKQPKELRCADQTCPALQIEQSNQANTQRSNSRNDEKSANLKCA